MNNNVERRTTNDERRDFAFGGSLFINVLASVDIYLSCAGLWAEHKKTPRKRPLGNLAMEREWAGSELTGGRLCAHGRIF
eukprot:scaffold9724_cov47-Attheya_sp.AAC.1